MTSKVNSQEQGSPTLDPPSAIEEQIRQRAYQLYEQRGRVEGSALDDWLHAQEEIHTEQEQPEVKAAVASK